VHLLPVDKITCNVFAGKECRKLGTLEVLLTAPVS
jgi:hypothetical protein